MKMHDIASRLAGHLACQVKLDESKVDTVRFGLEIILGEAIKWTILLGAAYLIGVIPGALYAMISMAIFRMVSGGAHCDDYWRCLVFGLIVFLGGGKMGVYISPYFSQMAFSLMIAISLVVMIIATVIWAPGEVPNRRIKPQERGMFKKLSLVFLVIWSGITVLVIVPHSIPAAVAGYLAMLVQTFSFTPPGYKTIDGFDVMLSRMLGERRCSHA